MIAGILLGIVTGLLTNELFEFSPWIARKLVRWAAFRRYTDRGRAEMRAEEWTAVINDRPGKLFKLITAVGFAAAAVIASGRRAVGREPGVSQLSKTGLLNAAAWERKATAAVDRAVRTKAPLAIMLLDIDQFKVINDTYGHLAGDQVLKELARFLKIVLRDHDLAGWLGGEEFSLLLPQTREVDAFRIAERVRADIADLSVIVPGATGGERVCVTVSIGVASLNGGYEFVDLMKVADAALYRAKSAGRDQVQMISTSRGLSAQSRILGIPAG